MCFLLVRLSSKWKVAQDWELPYILTATNNKLYIN